MMSDKPSWDDAPDWAGWLAMDKSGVWCWFVGMPHAASTLWLPSDDENPEGDTFDFIDGMSHEYPIPWNETLESRP